MGVCFGVLREMSDSGFRTADQVRDELGLEFLGMLPEVEDGTAITCTRRVAQERRKARRPIRGCSR